MPDEIVVTDVKIPFSSLVILMVKAVLASIPALIILFGLGMAALVALSMVGISLR